MSDKRKKKLRKFGYLYLSCLFASFRARAESTRVRCSLIVHSFDVYLS